MAVTYLSTGSGDTSATSPLSWTHTIATADGQTVVIVAVSVSSLVNLGPFGDVQITATYGATEMTLGVWSETGVFLNGIIDVFGGGIAVFYLLNPPTGEQTVTVEASGFTMSGLSGNSVAYDNVIGFTGLTRTCGSSASVTVPTITDDLVVAVFSTGLAPTDPTGTQRFSEGAGYVGTGDYVSLQDTAGNISETLGVSNWLISGVRAVGFNLCAEVDLADRCTQILAATRRHRRDEDRMRRQRPLVRIWDGEWALQHILSTEYSAQFAVISNDSGPAKTEIPMDSPVAQWIADEESRLDRDEGRSVHLTVDYCGARMGYRLDKQSREQREDGDTALSVTWLHDYEETKWYTCWSNPFLPSGIQLPRAFIFAGPVTWLLKLALFLQIFREHNPLITMPDDPLDLSAYLSLPDQSDWATVVKPTSFLDAVASGDTWGVFFSRWKNWHDAAHTMLEDGEKSVTCRRYLQGDPPPWPGAVLRYGTNVIDIVDKSGVLVGTSHGGTIFDGLARTVAEFTEDFLESTLDAAVDVEQPTEYTWPWSRLTKPQVPYVVFREGEGSPIQTSQFIRSPAKGVQMLVGGHSMPGVNEAISASIQAAGDILGSVAQIGSLGGTIDTLLQPLYEDTILAFFNAKLFIRAGNSGWSRYFEYFVEPSGKAYTIASLMVLRSGVWATRNVVSWKVTVVDGGAPYLVGDNGVGHFWLDDRIGLVLKGDSRIHMDRARKIELAWDEQNPPEFRLTVGDDRIWQDPAARAWGKLEQLTAGLHEMGLF